MFIFATFVAFIFPVMVAANSVCIPIQQLFLGENFSSYLVELKKQKNQSLRFQTSPQADAKQKSQDLQRLLEQANFDSHITKQWASDLIVEITNNPTISYLHYFSYAFRTVTLLSIKQRPEKFDLDAKYFSREDFASIENLVTKLETMSFQHLRVPIHKALEWIRKVANLPNHYLFLPTQAETPYYVLNQMIDKQIWLTGVIPNRRSQHGIGMIPFVYFMHDILHFKFFIENHSHIALTDLEKVRTLYEQKRQELEAKDQERLDFVFFYWWFEKGSLSQFIEVTSHRSKDVENGYVQTFVKNLSWDPEIPLPFNKDIREVSRVTVDFLQFLFINF